MATAFEVMEPGYSYSQLIGNINTLPTIFSKYNYTE